MNKKEDTRMPLTLVDVNGERLERLRELFPEAVSDGKIDLERLGQALGEAVDDGRERYGLSWAGKGDAIRAIQVPSVGTLIPCPDESVDFDTTENLFIEGDNLEVLKLLQKSYHGKVKMIYIDPPYNTGNEFIYPDNFRDGLQEYLRFTGQVDGEGVKLSTNRETSGRYHSNWLSMMYPRLFMARNLLREDGLIFISIDDNEVHNLRLLMDEVFGAENFLDTIIWKKRYGGGAKEKFLVSLHEYILLYARNKDSLEPIFIPTSNEAIERYYKLRDNKYKIRGPYRTHPLEATKSMGERKNLVFSIPSPDGRDIWPKRQWLWSKKRVLDALENNLIEFLKSKNGEMTVHTKQYLRDEQGKTRKSKAFSVIDNVYTQHGTNEILDLFADAHIFSFPKPTGLIKPLLKIATNNTNSDIVLDFFAGSGTTGHSVIDLNREDGGNRKFIMVQLPEQTDGDTFPTIADVCKERIRRVIKKLKEEDEGKLDLKDREKPEDLGFKVFKLSSSNFKIWDAGETQKDEDGLAEQLNLYADHVLSDRSDRDILFELLLKAGRSLTAKIEEKKVEGKTVYSIEDGTLLICLEERVTAWALRGMVELKPRQVICLDNAFGGNDQLKTNTVLEMRDHEIKFMTV